MLVKLRKRDAGMVIQALSRELTKARRRERIARSAAQVAQGDLDDERGNEGRLEESRLLQGLLDVLGKHVGETGMSEGAVETLHRLIAERDVAREKLEAIERVRIAKSAGYGKHPVVK